MQTARGSHFAAMPVPAHSLRIASATSKIAACLRRLLSCRPVCGTAHVAAHGEPIGVVVGCDHQDMSGGETDLPRETFYVSDLAVLPAFRRHGIGTALVETLVARSLPPYRHVFLHSAHGSTCHRAFMAHGYERRRGL